MKIDKVLLVYNKPRYQLHVLEKRDPFYIKLLKQKHQSAAMWKPIYEAHQASLESAYRTLELLGLEVQSSYRKDLKKCPKVDLIVTIGGDGTFLETSHLVEQSVLLGLNAAPNDSTGALCRATKETFLSVLVDLMTDQLKAKKIPRLKIKLGKKILPYKILNEVLFANTSPGGTSRYQIQIGKEKEEHKSSGLWVATGTGSTAAISSAGGKKRPVDDPNFQYLVREPLEIKKNQFKLKKGLLNKKQKLILVPTMRQSALYMDGNYEVPVPYGERVEISNTGKSLKAIL
ncbi:MAG: NAD(+)/NADH kinase [Deltaproteobacteria bacterium]|nr:NAD(+)/NADH kinase [Deltaproteobacteria bacterium]